MYSLELGATLERTDTVKENRLVNKKYEPRRNYANSGGQYS
jgi:hypothetical protein